MRKLIDRKAFLKKYLNHHINNPFVIYPFAAGTIGAFATWVFNFQPSIFFLFASAVVGIAIPIGSLITKWTTGTDEIAKRVHEELLQETQHQQEEDLNALHIQLKKDGDMRTEQMLEELRTLHKSFQEDVSDAGWMASLPLTVSADITRKVTELFTQAVQCLKDTLRMYEKSKNSKLVNVRRVLQERREQLIADVEKTIVQLTQLYARVITLSPDSNETELSRLRSELDESLAFAKKVDEQIRSSTQNPEIELPQTAIPDEDTQTLSTQSKVESTEQETLQ